MGHIARWRKETVEYWSGEGIWYVANFTIEEDKLYKFNRIKIM